MSAPLLMIHGLLGSLDYFAPARYLPSSRIHMPDMAGYGLRRSEEDGIDLPGQAFALARLLREEIREPAWLLGHSVGGAVAMMVADLEPSLVRGLISVEGNFTLRDAFWCARVATLDEETWAAEYGAMEDAPAAWLEKSGIEAFAQAMRSSKASIPLFSSQAAGACDERIAWAKAILNNQPYTTVQRMARSVVHETGKPEWLDLVRRVLVRDTPVYLLGGEQSAAGWDVPEFVLAAARQVLVQPRAGHMMMLEEPGAFCRIVGSIIEGNKSV